MLSEKEIKKNHEICLEMLDKFIEVCEKNDIEYYVSAGTALGVVRHAGFIPWDGNIDMHMLPGEYNRFDSIMQKEDLGEFIWEAPCEEGRIVKALMYKKDPELLETPDLDIKICAYVPDNIWIRFVLMNIAYFNYKMFKLKNTPVKRRFPFNILKGIASLIPNKVYYAVIDWFGKVSEKNEDAKYRLTITPGYYGRKAFIKSDWYGKEKKYGKFENRKVRMMRRTKAYLKWMYGDFMTPEVWEKGTYRMATPQK